MVCSATELGLGKGDHGEEAAVAHCSQDLPFTCRCKGQGGGGGDSRLKRREGGMDLRSG